MKVVEIWKDVAGYNGAYQVSNYGNVRSFKRGKPRLLKANSNSHGYYQVNLSKNGHFKSMKVHQLVAMAFLGHSPCRHLIVVDHIDNDKTNNTLSNLQLVTTRVNCSKDRKGKYSDFTGVTWDAGVKKWRAQGTINGRNKYLGIYKTEAEAHGAYLKAIKDEH